MNATLRTAIAAALLASLAACGNKGPLIKPSVAAAQAAEQAQQAMPAPATPESAVTPDMTTPPPTDDSTAPATPVPTPDPDVPPPSNDGGGNG